MSSVKDQIPDHLRHKLPKVLYDPFYTSNLCVVCGLGFSVCSLYGPIIGQSDHNGLLELFGPLICPWLAVIYYHIAPFSPYRGISARFGGMTDLDKRDPDAKLLVEIYRSKEAQRLLALVTVKVCAVLVCVWSVDSVYLQRLTELVNKLALVFLRFSGMRHRCFHCYSYHIHSLGADEVGKHPQKTGPIRQFRKRNSCFLRPTYTDPPKS
jgi:hypothetical protein